MEDGMEDGRCSPTAHSARRPRERTAADEVEVEVEHALPGALAVVAHEAEVVEPLLLWG